MAQGAGESYAFDYERTGDGALGFRCSGDARRWPWLSLPPRHPLVIQTQNFWASFGALRFEGGLEEGQWSALTWTDWSLGDARAGHAVRGVYQKVEAEAGPAFGLTLFDAQDRSIVTTRGRGVVFRNRNFEKWREASKQVARKDRNACAFTYAEDAQLALGEGEFALVAPLAPGETRIEALVTPENGMPPANRVISGSGDHVNTTHFGEVTRQALCLVTRDPEVQVTGGEMTLKRYVELGTPFALTFERDDPGTITFTLEQLDKQCAQITLHWSPPD